MDNDKTWYIKQAPKLGGAFHHFTNTSNETSALDTKTKELLKLSLACAFRCKHCTEAHIKKALEVGATKEEITEALLIVALEGAGTEACLG